MLSYYIDTMTINDLETLLRSGNDDYDNQLRVSYDGEVYISQDVVGADDIEDVLFRLGTFDSGNEMVGPKVSNDRVVIEYMYKAIKENWRKGVPFSHLDEWCYNY